MNSNKTNEQIISEVSSQNKKMRRALNLFISNVDKWLETGVPANPEESKRIYDLAKEALENENVISPIESL